MKNNIMYDTLPMVEECETAAKEMKINKSPDIDGLSNDFYKKFWKDLYTSFYGALYLCYSVCLPLCLEDIRLSTASPFKLPLYSSRLSWYLKMSIFCVS